MVTTVSAQALWTRDALWAGASIAARLRDQVPDLRQVLLIDEVDGKAGGPKQFPSAMVLLDSMRPTDVGQRVASVATVLQDWVVSLAVRSPARDPDRNATEAGRLIPAVVRALHGWAPAGQLRPLAWGPGMRPQYGRDYSLFPLTFTLQVVTA